MELANPIYDAVFKFLMDDRKVAALIIGGITGFDVEEVELRPSEILVGTERKRNASAYTVYRLDFAAKIKTPEGHRQVIIEIQKAKLHTDIQRFRKYLGSQYSSPENYVNVPTPGKLRTRKQALPIYSIYILGHKLNHFDGIPVIKVSRQCIDVAAGCTLDEKDEFIESLTHDSAIIQIPELKERRRNRLEKMLSIFDQARISSDNHHQIGLDEEGYPEEFRPIIRRLTKAISNKKIRQLMEVEDDLFSELEDLERQASEMEEVAEQAKLREEEERRQKEEAQDREKEAQMREKEAQKQKENLLQMLKDMGVSDSEIIKRLDSL